MTRGKLITAAVAAAITIGLGGREIGGQTPQVPAFKGGVDMVRVAAVVRDRKGRFVQDLTARDFEVTESGKPKAIADFRTDIAGVSIAILFDVSGSMEGHLVNAREAARHVLSWLDESRDEAAVFTFDTHLDEVVPFRAGLKDLPASLNAQVPFGATSLHDAIALTAKRVGAREGRRRAVVVLTDGADNASHLKPAEVSAAASAIDVPVYIFGTVPSIDNPNEETATNSAERSAAPSTCQGSAKADPVCGMVRTSFSSLRIGNGRSGVSSPLVR